MWKYSSCAVQGKGHIRSQTPCQDKTLTVFRNGVYVISLSDGAGSAKLSHFGAECVVESIAILLTSRFDELFEEPDGRIVKVAIMTWLLNSIQEEAESRNCIQKDLASTLLAVAVKEDRFIIAHIGDGVVGYLDGLQLKVASAPSNGEHANETYFVTSADAINNMKLFKGSIRDKAGFVVMSDGTEQSMYNKRTSTLSNAIIKLMQRNVLIDEKSMNSQLEQTFRDLITTKTQDDCSIAILTRESPALRPLKLLSQAEKADLYKISPKDKNHTKRIKRYDELLELLRIPQSCAAAAKKIHLKYPYTKRHLEHLCLIGLTVSENGIYRTIC